MGSRRLRWTTIAVTGVVAAMLAACTTGKSDTSQSKGSSQGSSGGTTSTSSKAAAPAAVLALSPATGKTITPKTPISASIQNGTITTATLTSSSGTAVKGALSADRTSWKATQVLGYSKTYTLKVVGKNADGKAVTKTSTIKTVTPGNFTMPYLQTIYNQGLTKNGTYGVGMVVNIHFDEPITNKAAAEKAIQITSTPAVKGAFYWVSDEVMHWRPKGYWKPGTVVSVKANTYGVQLGDGLWGQADKATSFKIGRSLLTIADDHTYHVKTYLNGKLVRDMKTAMGKHMYVQGKNGPISLWTPEGNYTVMVHNQSVVMDSASFGLPHSSPYGYKETIYWATRITNGGVFLHYLESTVGIQGYGDASHGCLNLNHDNAVWFFDNSLIGDPVQVRNTDSPKESPAQLVADGGDWTLTWAQWVKGGVNKS